MDAGECRGVEAGERRRHRGRSGRAGRRRSGPALLAHHESRDLHRRWGGALALRARRGGRRSRVLPVPSDGLRRAGRLALPDLRGGARPWSGAPQPSRGGLHKAATTSGASSAARDIVARSIVQEMQRHDLANVWLDATRFVPGRLRPPVSPPFTPSAGGHGCDPEREPIPVAPAAHYMMGGSVDRLLGPGRPSRASSRAAKPRAPGPTAPIGWPATRSSKASCSGRASPGPWLLPLPSRASVPGARSIRRSSLLADVASGERADPGHAAHSDGDLRRDPARRGRPRAGPGGTRCALLRLASGSPVFEVERDRQPGPGGLGDGGSRRSAARNRAAPTTASTSPGRGPPGGGVSSSSSDPVRHANVSPIGEVDGAGHGDGSHEKAWATRIRRSMRSAAIVQRALDEDTPGGT